MNCNLYLALQIGWTRIVCRINIQSYREEMHLHSAICCLSSIFERWTSVVHCSTFFSINYPITSQIIYLLQVVLFWDIIFKSVFFLVCWKTLHTDFTWLNAPYCRILIHVVQLEIYCVFCSFQILLMWNALIIHGNSLKPPPLSPFLSLTHRPQIIVQFSNK